MRIGNDSFVRATETGLNWSTWSFEIDTTAYPNGTHTINVLAFDNASQGEGYWIDLVIRNEEDTNGDGGQDGEGGDGDSDDDFEYMYLIFAFIVIALILLLFFILRRKMKGEEEPEEEEPG